jgi:hypothetical protein
MSVFIYSRRKRVYSTKVKSGVMRMRRKEDYSLPCGEKLFYTVVKLLFSNVENIA